MCDFCKTKTQTTTKQKEKQKQQKYIGFYSDIYKPISVKLGMKIETTKHYIVIPVWTALTNVIVL